MKRALLVIAVICAVVAAVVISLPIFGRTAARGTLTKNLSNAKQLGTGVRLFAMDHQGRFPMHLSELFPDYVPSENWRELLFIRARVTEDESFPAPQYEWLYFGAFCDEQHRPTILIASPQVFYEKGKLKRIIVFGDGSGTLADDEEFQTKLRQTIKELNERAATLMPKRESSALPVAVP
jgi:hypothetical protein